MTGRPKRREKDSRWVIRPTPVQYTGDWSSNSKLSAIQNGYWKDDYFEILNKVNDGGNETPRRTSLICRGYYVRARICDHFLRNILRKIEGRFQIVSLGSGMDSTFFRLFEEFGDRMRYYDVDFEPVISRRHNVIMQHEILRSLACSHDFHMFSADLRNLTELNEMFDKFDTEWPTIFYSECVVNYLKPAENDALLHFITSKFPNSVWLAYEQCFPRDAFGHIMVSHFQKNRCPILSIEDFDDMKKQEMQLQNAGFEQFQVFNSWDSFAQIAKDEFQNLNPHQQFDEYEAFVATCLHYSVRVGSNLDLKLDLIKGLRHNVVAVLPLKNLQVSSWDVSVTDHSSAFLISSKLIIIGGIDYKSGRLSQVTVLDYSTQSYSPVLSILANSSSPNFERLHSCATYIASNNTVYIFGGRKSPETLCSNDLVLVQCNGLDILSTVIFQTNLNWPSARWRHAMAPFTCQESEHVCKEYIFLFGGKDGAKEVLGDCWLFDLSTNRWLLVKPVSSLEFPSPRHSHSMCYDSKRNLIYMIGGISDDDVTFCEQALWMYKNYFWRRMGRHDLIAQRIGHQTLVHEDSLIIVGGYGNASCMIEEYFLAVVNLETGVESFFKLVREELHVKNSIIFRIRIEIKRLL